MRIQESVETAVSLVKHSAFMATSYYLVKPPFPSRIHRSQSMKIATREELINALMDAAEIEHNLACLYLFAAFTIKDREDELDAAELPNASLPNILAGDRWMA